MRRDLRTRLLEVVLLILAGDTELLARCVRERAAALVPTVTCTRADERFAPMRAALLEAVSTSRVASVSVAVVAEDGVLWRESFGWRDVENRRAATPQTPYLLASLGKSLTGTAVLRLVDEGRVKLDAPAARYLGGAQLTAFEGSADGVSVRHLLDMTAAIPHSNLEFRSRSARDEYTTADLVENRGIVVFPPGEVQLYSNTNFAVLEQLVETVSGRTFSSFMSKEVFKPMRMKQSRVGGDDPRTALQYDSKLKRVPNIYALPESSRAMYASLDDLVSYAQQHLRLSRVPLLRRETLHLMQHARSPVPRALMALGIAQVQLPSGRSLLLSNGRADGAQATLAILEREKLAVICLVNTSGDLTDGWSFSLLDLLSPGFLAEFSAYGEAHARWAEQPFVLTDALEGEWRGDIRSRAGSLPIKLRFAPEGAVVAVADQPESAVRRLRYDEGLLRGAFTADVPAEERAGRAHNVTIALRPSGGVLSGFVTSEITNDRGTFYLPSYVRVERVRSGNGP